MDELDPTIPLPPPSDSPRTGSPPSKSKGWQPPSTEELQAQLPQYEITALLGRGGMGAVYKGTQKNLDRPVAIKILPPDMDEDESGANFHRALQKRGACDGQAQPSRHRGRL
jgi:serine/threonine protein kinase